MENNVKDTVASLVDNSQPGFFSNIANKLGVGLWSFVLWMATNPEAIRTITKDGQAIAADPTNVALWQQLETDLVADWQASQAKPA